MTKPTGHLWALVLVRLRWDGEAAHPLLADTIPLPTTPKPSEQDLQLFYTELLRLDWLSPKLRNAIMREAGISPRKRDQEREAGRTSALWMEVKKREDKIRKAKERPRGGAHEAAISAIAQEQGMTVEALKKRFQRLKPR